MGDLPPPAYPLPSLRQRPAWSTARTPSPWCPHPPCCPSSSLSPICSPHVLSLQLSIPQWLSFLSTPSCPFLRSEASVKDCHQKTPAACRSSCIQRLASCEPPNSKVLRPQSLRCPLPFSVPLLCPLPPRLGLSAPGASVLIRVRANALSLPTPFTLTCSPCLAISPLS